MKFNDFFKLRDVTINTTNSCNMRCKYCFEDGKDNRKVTTENMIKIVDKCYENYKLTNDSKSPFVVNFFGGEPFLNFKVIEETMKHAREQNYNIVFGATTNMTILTDHMIDVIEDYELGLLISIDGIKEIHDRNRCNSYDTVKKNVQKMIDRGLGYLMEARMTIMPKDVDYLLNSIKSIIDMGIVDIAPVPVTDTEWTEEELENFYNKLNEIWQWLFEIYNNDENKKNISLKFIEDYIEAVLTVPLNDYQTKVCSAGTFTSCSIGVNGDILPCHQRHSVKNNYHQLVMGNILEDTDIKEVEFNNETIHGAFDCDDCVAKSICKGGCPSENLTLNGNGNQMNEIQCLITMIMVSVAQENQLNLLQCKNVRSRRLNILKQNLELLNYLFTDVLIYKDDCKIFNLKLLTLYEKIVDMGDILLPNFNNAIQSVIKQVVNISNEELSKLKD